MNEPDNVGGFWCESGSYSVIHRLVEKKIDVKMSRGVQLQIESPLSSIEMNGFS